LADAMSDEKAGAAMRRHQSKQNALGLTHGALVFPNWRFYIPRKDVFP